MVRETVSTVGTEIMLRVNAANQALRLAPFLDGVLKLDTVLSILRSVASKTSASSVPSPDWYTVVQIEPFSHINSVKELYRKLALALHPDKNPCPASEDAFKLVGEAFRCLSDKARGKEFDHRLRVSMHAAASSAEEEQQPPPDAFRTACSTCRLMHQFERRYVGHKLMCPSCKKSFLAVEVSNNDSSEGEDDVDDDDDDDDGALSRVRARASKIGKGRARIEGCSKPNRKMCNGREISRKAPRSTAGEDVEEDSDDEVLGKLLPKRLRVEREMTLAEMQLEAKRKARVGKMKRKEAENGSKQENDRGLRDDAAREGNLKTYRRRSSGLRDTEVESLRSEDSDIMAEKDSDFYDFDKNRMDRGFKRGQVWATYEDKDEMPRHYGLVENFVSLNPFEVEMSWLDLQSNGIEGLFPWDRYGLHTSCGRFKVARKGSVILKSIFSHVVDCERVARELYWIYPKKGSVWALYKETALENGGRKSMRPWHYDIVVMLSSYNDMFGASMAYLEKLDGFRTVFRRKEIGCHAIRLLKQDELQLISHQIPAKKFSAEAPELSNDCWELDPAAIPI